MTIDVHKKEDAEVVLVDLRTRRRIFHIVLIAHIVIIIIILVWGFATDFFKPPKQPKALTVSLYTPPKSSSTPKTYTPPKAKRIKKTVAKKVKKKKKKKWKAATKINISKKLVYIKPKKTTPKVKPIDKQKLVMTIKQKNTKISSKRNNQQLTQSYENSVGAYLYQLWDTPDKSVLGATRPEVKIQLNIAANGQLLYAKILKPSGVPAMDKSVQELLKKVKYLPAPKAGAKQITLILEVIE